MAVDTTVEVTMPAMGDSVSEGTVLEWHKQEGDQVSEDETLVEISTDKVDAEVPAPAEGTVVKIHASEGDTVQVGTVLAEIAPGGNAAPKPDEGEPAGETVDIVMPAMGESSEGTIRVAAARRAGRGGRDRRRDLDRQGRCRGPAPASGTIEEILAQAGDTVTVGQVIARMTTSNGASAPAKAPEPTAAPRPQASAPPKLPDEVKVTPVAACVADALGVDLSRIHGSGPAGRIVKDDVLAAENGATAAPEATLLKGASAMLARYMDESRAIPTATSFRTLTVTALDSRRKQLKEAGHRVSFTHLIAFAIARAATEQMPVMARSFTEIDGKPHVVDAGAVNLGIAVDVERKDGGRTLMVPVIRDAGRLSFPEFLDAFNDLITRARDNSLTADDLQGANLSLTNPGGIGTIASVPRLMSGQGTIVATGAIGFPPGMANVAGAEKVMTMTSTYDHRIIQGAESGQFLQVVEQYLQGEHGFYEQVFSDLGVEAARPRPPRRRPRSARRAADRGARRARRGAAERAAAAGGAGRHVADQGPPHARATWRRSWTRSQGDPALDPEPLGLTARSAAIPAKILRTYVPGATLADALPHLRDTYCSTIAYEIEHIASHRQRMWLREKIESGAFRAPLSRREGASCCGG